MKNSSLQITSNLKDININGQVETDNLTNNSNKNEQKQNLYLELRYKGNPIDPSFWLSISNIKVSK